MSYRDEIDRAGEAEGIAADALALMTDEPQPVPLMRLRMYESADPRARPVRPFRYPRMAAIKAWLRALECLRTGRPLPRVRLDFDSRQDLERRQRDRRLYDRTIRKPTPRGAGGKFVAA